MSSKICSTLNPISASAGHFMFPSIALTRYTITLVTGFAVPEARRRQRSDCEQGKVTEFKNGWANKGRSKYQAALAFNLEIILIVTIIITVMVRPMSWSTLFFKKESCRQFRQPDLPWHKKSPAFQKIGNIIAKHICNKAPKVAEITPITIA